MSEKLLAIFKEADGPEMRGQEIQSNPNPNKKWVSRIESFSENVCYICAMMCVCVSEQEMNTIHTHLHFFN